MHDLSLAHEAPMRPELGLNAGGVADQQEVQVRMADERKRRGGNDHAWAVIAAHGVERYGDWSTHSPCRSGNDSDAAASPRQPPET
jgi:hypothetical protein